MDPLTCLSRWGWSRPPRTWCARGGHEDSAAPCLRCWARDAANLHVSFRWQQSGWRLFEVPPLQWDATSWEDIIDLKKVKVCEPLILKKLSDEEISSALDNPLVFPPYSLHSQSVERAVKLVSTATQNVCGAEKRHEYCLSIIASRKSRTAEALSTKKNYVVDETFL